MLWHGPRGLVAVRRRLGTGRGRQPAGAEAEKRGTHPLGRHLRRDGQAGAGRPVLLHALGSAGFAWVAAGGAFYTVGIFFYALDTRVTHVHGVWHLFVIAGSGAYYLAIFRYVV